MRQTSQAEKTLAKTLARLAPAVLALAFAAGCDDDGGPGQVVADLTVFEAYDMFQARFGDPDFVILDVRTAAEFASEHIPGAVNLDYWSPSFEDDLDALDRGKTYLVYCAAGSRSAAAVDLMASMGFMEVYDMLGGLTAWKDAGLPVET